MKTRIFFALVLMSVFGAAMAAGATTTAGTTKAPTAGAHVYFDSAGKRITGVADPKYLNCVQIECPKDFASGTRCWKCKKAIKAKK
jgi:hypothetical protein